MTTCRIWSLLRGVVLDARTILRISLTDTFGNSSKHLVYCNSAIVTVYCQSSPHYLRSGGLPILCQWWFTQSEASETFTQGEGADDWRRILTCKRQCERGYCLMLSSGNWKCPNMLTPMRKWCVPIVALHCRRRHHRLLLSIIKPGLFSAPATYT